VEDLMLTANQQQIFGLVRDYFKVIIEV